MNLMMALNPKIKKPVLERAVDPDSAHLKAEAVKKTDALMKCLKKPLKSCIISLITRKFF